MTLLNAYCTLDEAKRELAIEDPNTIDDEVLNECINDASRAIDGYCGGRRFFAASASHTYDVPMGGSREILLDDDWLSVSSITNGDGTAVATSLAYLWPQNAVSKVSLRLKEDSNLSWLPAGSNYESVITVAGSVGYVDRAASASNVKAGAIVAQTKRACVLTAVQFYRIRFGGPVATFYNEAEANMWGVAPKAAALIEGYRRLP